MNHYLMRHPEVSAPGLCVGQTDLPLSGEGKASVSRLIEAARRLNPDLVITSDLQRCRDFAQAAALETGCPVQSDVRWREINFGAWENRAWDEIRQDNQARFEQWSFNFQVVAPPQGESFQDMLKRVSLALEDLPREQKTLVVTHAGCIRAAACLLNVISPDRMFDWEVPYGALFQLNLEKRRLLRHRRGKKLEPVHVH